MRRLPLIAPLFFLAGCADSGAYTLAAAGPWKEGYGLQNKLGVELAVREINAGNGINGHKLDLIERDDRADGGQAALVASEFVANEKISAVIGHVNSGGMLSAARVYDGELPAVATSATSPDLSGISKWTFRAISSDSLNGVALANFASGFSAPNGGPPLAAVLYENNTYGRGLADSFRRAFKGTIISIDPIAGDMKDAEPYITYLKAHQPQVVFVAGRVPSGTVILREAKRQNFQPAFVGGDGWQGIAPDTALSEAVYIGMSFTPEDTTAAARKFVESFQAANHLAPDAHAALAYDATMLLAQALRQRGPGRRAIRDYLANLNAQTAYDGLTGKMYFEKTGDPVGIRFRVLQVHNGLLTVGAPQ
ncbi:MAG: ABC transporter substrate-binding protein [Gemmatimonadaceae bacterium]|nr:ABC transporter substrate-binding protein [Gemmatimonadaceae bacterium]